MIGLIAHAAKPEARVVVRELVKALRARKLPFALEKSTASLLGRKSSLDERALAREAELLVDDGWRRHHPAWSSTSWARIFARSSALTSAPGFSHLRWSRGDRECRAQHRGSELSAQSAPSLLDGGTCTDSAGRVGRHYALNDVVVSRGERSQLVKIHVRDRWRGAHGLQCGWPDYRHPDGLDRLFPWPAGGPVLMPDSGSVCHHADLPTRIDQSLHGRERSIRHRS